MKLNCGLSYQEEIIAYREWHRWYAWRPVRVGTNDCRWLETVERKGKWFWFDCSWEWEYRPLAT